MGYTETNEMEDPSAGRWGRDERPNLQPVPHFARG